MNIIQIILFLSHMLTQKLSLNGYPVALVSNIFIFEYIYIHIYIHTKYAVDKNESSFNSFYFSSLTLSLLPYILNTHICVHRHEHIWSVIHNIWINLHKNLYACQWNIYNNNYELRFVVYSIISRESSVRNQMKTEKTKTFSNSHTDADIIYIVEDETHQNRKKSSASNTYKDVAFFFENEKK